MKFGAASRHLVGGHGQIAKGDCEGFAWGFGVERAATSLNSP
jgi:phenylalanyl-tRNA synthetase alpha subunit